MKLDLLFGIYDKKAQWMLISGVLIALAVISMSVLLTEVSTSGSKISYSSYRIPYYEMRSLIVELTRAYRNGDINETNEYNVSRTISEIYALHGYCVEVTFKKGYNTTSLNTTPPIHIYMDYLCVNFSTKNLHMEVNKSVIRTSSTR